MTTIRCPASTLDDHTWPGELGTDAQCLRCGAWYSEWCDQLGDIFQVPEPEPEPDLLAEIDAYEYADVPEWTIS